MARLAAGAPYGRWRLFCLSQTMTLTAKQRVFVEEYLICWNGTEAARRAGYSVRTAQEQSSRLLSNAIVQSAIETRITQLHAKADEVLLRLASHSRGTMDDFVQGDYLNLERARERGVMHLIKKLKVKTTTFSKSEGADVETHEVEVELYDAQAATVQLARILGLFVDRVEINDWRSKVIDLLRTGRITRAEVAADLGDDIASELLITAGVPVSDGREAPAASEQILTALPV